MEVKMRVYFSKQILLAIVMAANLEGFAMESDDGLTDIEDLGDDFSLKLSPLINIDEDGLRYASLDGGGVLGIMQIEFLKKLEQETEKSISQMFHGIGGTSIGALIARALTQPLGQGNPKTSEARYSASMISDVMRSKAADIFETERFSCWGVLKPKYNPTNLETIVADFFGDTPFHRTTIDTLVTSYDLTRRAPHIFKSWDSRSAVLAYDAVLSATAAETYFPPRHFLPIRARSDSDFLTLADGGIFANNPTLIMSLDMHRRYPTVSLENYTVLSLGTGNTITPLYYDNMRNAGMLKWAPNLIETFMGGQSAITSYMADALFPNTKDGHQSYYRFDPALDQQHMFFDNASEHNITDLLEIEERLIESRDAEFKKLVSILKKPKADIVPKI